MAQRPLPSLPSRPGREDHAATGMRSRPADGAPWRAVREAELREIDRERALRHLLLEIGALCARSSQPEELVQGVLRRLVTGLDLVAAWAAFPARGAEDTICSTFGPVTEPDDLRSFARTRAAVSADAGPVRVPASPTTRREARASSSDSA